MAMERIYVTTPQIVLKGAHQGENLARCICFPIDGLKEQYGEGTWTIVFRRPFEADPYVVANQEEVGEYAVWGMDATDTAVAGEGRVELRYYVDDTLCKTDVYAVLILPSLGETGDAPSPYEDIIDTVAGYVNEAKAAVETVPETVAEMQAQLDEAISGVTVDSEVINARVDADGTTYSTLKQRLDAENTELKNEINVVASNQKTLFGAKWDRTTNLLTRTRDAADITTDTTNFCHRGTLNANYDNPFDSIYPWSEMVVCNVDLTKYRSGNYKLTDCICAVYGDPDFTYYGSDTIFVGRYRPRFWYRSAEDTDGNVEFLVSQIERAGFRCAEEVIDGISFVVDDGSGNNTVTCGTNVPLTNIAVATIHTRAKNSGFTLQDIYTLDQQIILYLVEYANMNSQQAIGSGCSSCYREKDADIISNVTVVDGKSVFDVGSAIGADKIFVGTEINFGASRSATTYKGIVTAYELNDGVYTITLDRELAIADDMHCNVHGFVSCEFPLLGQSLGNASGYLGTDTKANVFYRGALLYANRYSYVLGIYRQTGTGHIWLCPDGLDPDDYDELNTAVHKDTGVALPELASAAWQTVGGNAQRIEDVAAFMITGTSSGSSSSPVGDQQYVPLPSTGNTILLFGCNADDGWTCGVFSGYWHRGSGNSSWYGGGLPILKRTL